MTYGIFIDVLDDLNLFKMHSKHHEKLLRVTFGLLVLALLKVHWSARL